MNGPGTWTCSLAAVIALAGCRPDLVVENLSVDWTGSNRTVEVTIRNAGNAGAGDFLVYVDADELPISPNRRPQIRHTVSGLAAGASIALPTSDFAPLAHPDNAYLANVYQITVTADPKGMVEESNEDNNRARQPTEAAAIELRDRDDNLVTANPVPLTDPRQPLLFVHGHALGDPMDQGLNYRKNWQQPLDYALGPKLPSFAIALDLPQNAGLELEPYYLRLQDQDRSIHRDAAAVGEAVERILRRHDDPGATQVKVAIIAFSKGTLSSRWYLANLLPASRPVSEHIAIAPPNHGLALTGFQTSSSLALRQVNNGYDSQCASFNEAESQDFVERLNGHPIEDTMTDPPQGAPHDAEAPHGRASGAPIGSGVLYIALYADANRDSVGGGTASGDCQGRRVAKNLAQNAVNLEVAQIPGPIPALVHANAVHTPEVICLALYAAAHHQAPPGGTSCAMQTVDGRQVPVIPPP